MKRRAFTLIELSVVVLILAIFSAAVVPNMASTIEGGKRRGFRVSVITLIRQAKQEAIARGELVTLTTNGDGGFQIVTTANDQDSTIKQVSPVSGVTASNFMAGGKVAGDTDWRVGFYSDGTCDGGSFEFQEGNNTRTVLIAKKDSSVTQQYGSADQTTSDQEWQAGDYAKSG